MSEYLQVAHYFYKHIHTLCFRWASSSTFPLNPSASVSQGLPRLAAARHLSALLLQNSVCERVCTCVCLVSDIPPTDILHFAWHVSTNVFIVCFEILQGASKSFAMYRNREKLQQFLTFIQQQFSANLFWLLILSHCRWWTLSCWNMQVYLVEIWQRTGDLPFLFLLFVLLLVLTFLLISLFLLLLFCSSPG